MARPTLPAFSLFAPPYREYLPFDPDEGFPTNPEVLWGVALVWSLAEGHAPRDLDLVAERPGGLPVMLILPPADSLRRLRSKVLEAVEDTRPQSVLPHHPHPDPEEMAHLLVQEPASLSGELVDYLMWRGMYLDREMRQMVRRIVELSAELRTLTALARGVYLSRRALGRRFRSRGLPVPSNWLQFCRVLRATMKMQGSGRSVHDAARALGYPDGFTLSNQMDRLVGVRPSVARERLGWEWIVEAWLQAEARKGGMTLRLRGLGSEPPSSSEFSGGTPSQEIPRLVEGREQRKLLDPGDSVPSDMV